MRSLFLFNFCGEIFLQEIVFNLENVFLKCYSSFVDGKGLHELR